jgi:hypothetical protein
MQGGMACALPSLRNVGVCDSKHLAAATHGLRSRTSRGLRGAEEPPAQTVRTHDSEGRVSSRSPNGAPGADLLGFVFRFA